MTEAEVEDVEKLPELVGGAVCLDVANSVDGRVLEVPVDYLGTYADLVDWLERAGGLSSVESAALLAVAGAEPEAAADELARARALREAVFDLFHGRAVGGAPDATAVQRAYTDALRHARLEPGDGGLGWAWELDLRLPRWRIAQSAIELATSPSLGRVKACASQDGCQYLFVDTSKNGSRRWCSMTDCGNQAKSRRLTERRRAGRV
ncbi:ABATE domain-containing protein [uncultured Cellulomonas sp.]|uniref:CGNR zinc finger domain-containing protein n=1 Tax=uncultured Cellulomonas sp. TaxID=189682 RepID=UPI0028E7E38C|nr:ABATE domain-containing protein [uncultured Cellulomonas sp.]